MRTEAEEGQAEVARAGRGKGLGGEKKRVKRQKGYICCEGGKRGERIGHCFCKWMLLLLLGFLCFQLCTMPCFCLFCSLCSRFFVAFYFSCLEIIAAFMEWSTVVKSLLQLRKVGKNKVQAVTFRHQISPWPWTPARAALEEKGEDEEDGGGTSQRLKA